MKKILVKLLKTTLIIGLLLVARGIVFADVNLTVRNGADVIFSGAVTIPTSTTTVNDSNGNPRTINASSVLAILSSASQTSGNFTISSLIYYSSFTPPSLYLKCITIINTNTEKCDNWQYAVINSPSSFESIDQKILSDGEEVYVYFGPQNKVVLSQNSITTSDTFTVITHKYDYTNNQWVIRTGVTVGLTQPDPLNPFSPIEIQTSLVDASGQAIFQNIPLGNYNVGIREDFYFPTETLSVTTPPPAVTNRGGGGHPILPIKFVIKPTFDLEKAINFIILEQKENGSFGEDLYTDWVAIALGGINASDLNKNILKKYLLENKLTNSASLTDFERRAIALMSVGLNPYETNNENYIKKIVENFDGKQFGNPEEDNDDIFALIVLLNAGFTQTEKIISDTINFILSRQKENGSWDESVDMTGAGIQALMSTAEKSCFLFGSLSAPAGTALPLGSPTCETPQNKELFSAVSKAKEFLKQNQKNDGSWGNVSSTAWAMGGILALGEKAEDWIKNNNSPLDYLGVNQDIDGGIKNEYMQNKIWETAYVITALSGKTWNQIMQKFEKPKEEIKLKTDVLEKVVQESSIVKIVAKKLTKNKQLAENKKNLEIKNPINQRALVLDSLPKENKEIQKKNWFTRFIEFIFY